MGEVLDPCQTEESRFTGLEVFVDWIGFVSIDIDFPQNRERDTIIQLTKLLNILIRAWFLTPCHH
jgi:hypothetical protein